MLGLVSIGCLDVHGIDFEFMCHFVGSLHSHYETGSVSEHDDHETSETSGRVSLDHQLPDMFSTFDRMAQQGSSADFNAGVGS